MEQQKTYIKITGYSVVCILVFSIISFAVCNLKYMLDYPQVFSYKEWIWFPVACFFIGCIFMMGRGINLGGHEVSPMVIGFVVSNILCCIVLLTYDTQPASDWKLIWQAANEMAQGTFSGGITNGHYMHECPYQLGLAYIESLFIKLFGPSFPVLKIINLILLNIISFCVYHFSKRKASLEVAYYAYMASCCFLCFIMTVSQFTNHQPAFILICLSLFLYEKDTAAAIIFSGITTACLNFIRPMGIMILAAVVLYSGYLLVVKKKKHRPLTHLLMFLSVYLAMNACFDTLLLSKGYTDERVSHSSRNIYHKITYGLYSSRVDGHISDYEYDYDKYNQDFREELLAQVKNNPKEITINAVNKMVRYLGLFDYQFEMTYDHDESVWMRYPIKAVYSIQWFQYLFYLVFAVLGGCVIIKKKQEPDIYQVFFIINTLVYFCVEAFSSYRFENYFYMLFLVGVGLNELNKRRRLV